MQRWAVQAIRLAIPSFAFLVFWIWLSQAAEAETCPLQLNSECVAEIPLWQSEQENLAAPQAPEPSVEALAEEMMSIVNAERAAQGLRPLELHPWALEAARAHAGRLAAGGRLWHNPAYLAQGRRAMGASLLGENAAMGQTLDAAHRALMNSPLHRKNLLDRRFSHLGVGISRDPAGTLFVVQDFARIGAESPAERVAAERPFAVLGAAPEPAGGNTHSSRKRAPEGDSSRRTAGLIAALALTGAVLRRRAPGVI